MCVWNAYKNTQCSVLSLVTVHLRMVNKLHFVHCAIGAEKWEQIGPEKIYSNLFIYSSMCRPPSSSRISILRFYFRLLFTLSTTRCGFISFYALANVTTVNKTEIYAFNSEINGHNFMNEREIRSIQNALHISIHSIEFFVAQNRCIATTTNEMCFFLSSPLPWQLHQSKQLKNAFSRQYLTSAVAFLFHKIAWHSSIWLSIGQSTFPQANGSNSLSAVCWWTGSRHKIWSTFDKIRRNRVSSKLER